MSILYTILSFIPILSLLIISIWKGVKTGVYTGFILTALLFFIWGSDLLTFFASVLNALAGTLQILMIVFGAIFLYQVMEQKRYIAGIQDSLSKIHPDQTFRFLFLAFFLTAFFESVAGFGTPGAIVPLLLISMGFPPVVSVSVVLLIDGLFALSGAVGTPVASGLEIPLSLNPDSVRSIYLYSALIITIAGIVVLLFVNRLLKPHTTSGQTKTAWILYLMIMVPFAAASYFLQELTGLIASLAMAILAYFFLFRNRNFLWKPWVPYWLLVLLLLIPKIFARLTDILSYTMEIPSVFGTQVDVSLQPLKSPLIPFLLSAAYALYQSRDFRFDVKPVISKTFSVFVILFPSLAITQLMLNSGQQKLPSMIEVLAGVFEKAGMAYPVFSPLIGVLGAFISGSTTVSNIIFGSVQQAAAVSIGIEPEIILSLQLAGASLGNAICLFNIIAAAAVAGISDYSEILRKNLLPVILASLICSLLGYGLMWFVQP